MWCVLESELKLIDGQLDEYALAGLRWLKVIMLFETLINRLTIVVVGDTLWSSGLNGCFDLEVKQRELRRQGSPSPEIT